MAHIDCLPTEILQQIFSHCNEYYHQKLTISEVCHRWAEAVELLMLKRKCLIVRGYIVDWDGDAHLKMIGMRILQKTNRKYTCLEVEWNRGEPMRKKIMLKERLDICEERFPALERLFLKVPPNTTLAQFFDKRRDWLGSLTELNVEFKRMGRVLWSVDPSECEILLPNLKRLYCSKSTYDGNLQGGRFESPYGFTLNVPELCWLKVEMDDGEMANSRQSRFQEPDVCCLFLPSLKLKTSSKLVDLEIQDIAELSRRHIDNSEQFLKNLKVLELTWCSAEIAMQIWEKCSNLKELLIRLDSRSDSLLHVSPAMARNLEKLTLVNCSLLLDHQAVFSELKYIILDLMFMNGSLSSGRRIQDNVVHLVAPQLISLIALQTISTHLIVRHEDQIRTMEVTVGHWLMTTNPPPPNVTELTLRWPFNRQTEYRVVQEYLVYFPNLQRLRIYGSDVSHSLDFPAINKLPAIAKLQVFFAHRFTLRLSDFKKFSELKTLELTTCIIKAQPDDGEEVVLPSLEYCRVEEVAVEGYEGERFPIRVDGRLSPAIDMVGVSAKGRKIFSSRVGGVQKPYHVRKPMFPGWESLSASTSATMQDAR